MNLIKNSRILITGGAGFIGSNLCDRLLAQDNEVVCLDNFATGHRRNIEPFLANKNFSLIEGDIRNYDDCLKAADGVDYVLHQAALGSVPRSIKDPMTTTDVNIGGFVKMLFAAKECKVKRFVYAASSSTYGDSTELPKVEEKIGNPLSPYAITKFANELYAKNFSDIYGIQTIGLRYFNVFGRRQDPNGAYAAVIPKFIIQMLKLQSPIINGDGTNSRDFTFIDNVIQANQLAATTIFPTLPDSAPLNRVYNVACGERTTLTQLFQHLRTSLSTINPLISTIQPIYGPNRGGDIPHSLANISKARLELGYHPDITVREGLDLTCKWFALGREE
jgi:UDP-N-acetylglucosamine 4-epimerase